MSDEIPPPPPGFTIVPPPPPGFTRVDGRRQPSGPTPREGALDVLKAPFRGFARGVEELPGIPGDVANLGKSVSRFATDRLPAPVGQAINSYVEKGPLGLVDNAAAAFGVPEDIRNVAMEGPTGWAGRGLDALARNVLPEGVYNQGRDAVNTAKSYLPATTQAMGMTLPTGQGMLDSLAQVHGPIPHSTTGVGRVVEKAFEFLPQAAIPIGNAGLAARGIEALASGVGAQLGTEATRGTGLEPAAEIAGALLGGLGAGRSLEALTRERPSIPTAPVRNESEQILDAYNRLNLGAAGSDFQKGSGREFKPGFLEANVGGNSAAQLQGNVLPQLLGSSDVIADHRLRNLQAFNYHHQEIAQAYGSVNTSRAALGEGVRDAVTQVWQDAKAREGAVFEDIDNAFAGTRLPFEIKNVREALKNPVGIGHTDEFARGRVEVTFDPVTKEKIETVVGKSKAIDPDVQWIKETVERNPQGLTYADLRTAKRILQDKLDPSYVGEVNSAQVSQLLKAVDKDLDRIIKQHAPEFHEPYNQARENYAKAIRDYKESFKNLIGTKDAPIRGERVANILMDSASTGRSADIKLLKKVLDTIAPEHRGEITASVLAQLGSTEKDAVGNLSKFSIGKFLTEWKNFSPEAKKMLLSGNNDAGQLARSFDDLVAVAESLAKYEKYGSSSRSGVATAMMGQAVAPLNVKGRDILLGLATAGLNVAGAYGASKFLTSPTMAEMMAKDGKKILKDYENMARNAGTATLYGESEGIPENGPPQNRLVVPISPRSAP